MPDKVLNTSDNFFQQFITKMVKFSNISAGKYLSCPVNIYLFNVNIGNTKV